MAMPDFSSLSFLLAVGLIVGFVVLLVLMNIVYRRLEQKFLHLEGMERKFESHIERINTARVAEMKGLHQRIDAMEQKLNALLQPEGPHRELEKEKVRASRGK